MGSTGNMPNTSLLVLGMGNPLLDIIVDVSPEFLCKYNVKLNSAILAEKEHMQIYEEIKDTKVYPNTQHVAGGATQNSIRICQALLRRQENGARKTGFIGCIGADDNGKEMKSLMESENVVPLYCINDNLKTGVCAVLVNKQERSLVTDLLAANAYQLDHLRYKVWDYVENSGIIYSACYFITVCSDAMMTTGQLCAKMNKTYCINLAAPFIIEFFKDKLSALLPYADYIFGNESEFLHYAKIFDLPNQSDLEDIAAAVALLPKANALRPRVVVVTQGADAVILATKWQSAGIKITKYPVTSISSENIIDTNGAGDAFVGGFLYGLSKGGTDVDLDYCVNVGISCAHHIIQRSGCTFNFSDDKTFKLVGDKLKPNFD